MLREKPEINLMTTRFQIVKGNTTEHRFIVDTDTATPDGSTMIVATVHQLYAKKTAALMNEHQDWFTLKPAKRQR